ncbi:GNAT family N-acetyltransferase [Aquimarina hainanensis]|uniref:GNAT family N-acetyltransferase n=1 Tax=Aquimarina hainanensis TaxID=1578017 RepID=A0ABW5N686_9FLAO
MELRRLNLDEEMLVKKVVQLGNKNSRTLGLLPEGAIRNHIEKGFLFISVNSENNLYGYVLFSVTQKKRNIRIIHLCVEEEHRGKRIAKKLLDFLKEQFLDKLRGISLSCREDYVEASQFWERYGFKPVQRKRSRSKEEKYLIVWWYDFGSVDLFSNLIEETNSIKAVLDANIIIKARDKCEDGAGVKYLFSDWLNEVDYYYAPEIFNEINRDEDKLRAKKTRQYLQNFLQIKFKPDLRDSIYNQICKIVPGDSLNDKSDKLQLSECLAAEIEYFITTDKNVLEAYDSIFEKYGVQVLTPTDFILEIDEVNNKTNYYSSRLAGVNSEYKPIQSLETGKLIETFLAKEQSEKKHHLREIITSLSGDVKNSRTMIVGDNEGNSIGVWAGKICGDRLEIKLLRTKKGKLSDILFKQLVYRLVNLSIEKNKRYLFVIDEYLANSHKNIMSTLGFFKKGNNWIKLIDVGVVNSSQYFTKKNITEGYLRIDTVTNWLKSGSDAYKLQLERRLFPLKFSDIDIPTYIIPIRPYWASELFDYYSANQNIFGVKPELSWNRENVYYRSVKPITEEFPSRILWYVSKGQSNNNSRCSSIVGCSYLDEMVTGKPKDLFRRYKRFGVYEWKHIYELAGHDIEKDIKALEFSDTEVFKQVIPLEKVKEVFMKNGRKSNTFACPVKVNNTIFNQIYILGTK